MLLLYAHLLQPLDKIIFRILFDLIFLLSVTYQNLCVCVVFQKCRNNTLWQHVPMPSIRSGSEIIF